MGYHCANLFRVKNILVVNAPNFVSAGAALFDLKNKITKHLQRKKMIIIIINSRLYECSKHLQ